MYSLSSSQRKAGILPERNGRTGSVLVAVCWKVVCKSRNAWQMMMSCCCWNSFFTDRTRRNYWKNCWNGRSRKPLSLLRAQLYTTQRLVHCVLRRLLAGGLWFSAVMVCSKSYRGRYAVSAPLRSVQGKRPLDVLHPCAGCRQLPFCGLAIWGHLALQAVPSRQVS